MITALMIFHGIISVLLILLVLIQFGKGAEAGLFSGGGADSVVSGGGDFIGKLTMIFAAAFMVNSIVLAKLQHSRSLKSALDGQVPAVVLPDQSLPAEKKAPVGSEATPETKTETKKEQEQPL